MCVGPPEDLPQRGASGAWAQAPKSCLPDRAGQSIVTVSYVYESVASEMAQGHAVGCYGG